MLLWPGELASACSFNIADGSRVTSDLTPEIFFSGFLDVAAFPLVVLVSDPLPLSSTYSDSSESSFMFGLAGLRPDHRVYLLWSIAADHVGIGLLFDIETTSKIFRPCCRVCGGRPRFME